MASHSTAMGTATSFSVSRPRIRGAGSSMPGVTRLVAISSGRSPARFMQTPSSHRLRGDRRAGACSSTMNSITGVLCETARGPVTFATDRVVIATGGIGPGCSCMVPIRPGRLWPGHRVGRTRRRIVMADLEFMQFHPTALDNGSLPLKLVSETVRGEGALLIDEHGDPRFMANEAPGAELAPRDVSSPARCGGLHDGWTSGVSRRAKSRRRRHGADGSRPSPRFAVRPASIRSHSRSRCVPPRITTWAALP